MFVVLSALLFLVDILCLLAFKEFKLLLVVCIFICLVVSGACLRIDLFMFRETLH